MYINNTNIDDIINRTEEVKYLETVKITGIVLSSTPIRE